MFSQIKIFDVNIALLFFISFTAAGMEERGANEEAFRKDLFKKIPDNTDRFGPLSIYRVENISTHLDGLIEYGELQGKKKIFYRAKILLRSGAVQAAKKYLKYHYDNDNIVRDYYLFVDNELDQLCPYLRRTDQDDLGTTLIPNLALKVDDHKWLKVGNLLAQDAFWAHYDVELIMNEEDVDADVLFNKLLEEFSSDLSLVIEHQQLMERFEIERREVILCSRLPDFSIKGFFGLLREYEKLVSPDRLKDLIREALFYNLPLEALLLSHKLCASDGQL